MTANDRREPILEEAELPSEEKPFLLTELLREGLPRPLWRRPKGEESTATEEAHQHPVAERSEPQLAPAPIIPPSRRPEPHLAEERSWEESSTAATPASPSESIEATELARALQRIRKLSPAVADAASTVPGSENSTAAEIEPETSITEPLSTEELAGISVAETTPARLTEPEPLPPKQQANRDPSSSSDLNLLASNHLREFEALLQAEVERRVVAEMEERITQYLQQVWKEQVSLTLMRAVALEGIRLREGMAELVHSALPEVLQRVVSEELQNARLSTDTNDGNS